MQPHDLTGQRFGRLTAIKRISSAKWELRCDCGKTVTAFTGNITRGLTKSCGCFRRETTVARSATHQLTKSAEHKIWIGMRSRCNNPKTDAYPYYGGRGIAVCERWDSFANFLADMGPRPSAKHSIDRYPNNDGNYEPTNCRWATKSEQEHNKQRRSKDSASSETDKPQALA